jgi:glucan 1,3-beta-glucosidase
MRSSVLVSLLAAGPSIVAAAGTLGFALGTKMPNGNCKLRADYEADFDAISKNTVSKLVRGYSASDCNAAKEILPAAKAKGFKVVLGIWPDVQESFDKDTAAITAVAKEFAPQIYAVTVGSETLYRGNFTGSTLWDKIKIVKDKLPSTIKVGTADSWNKFADGTADDLIKKGVDILMVNAFAYWQGQDISNGTKTYLDDLMQAFQHIQTTAGGRDKAPELWNGETGWPADGGSDFGAAKHGTKNSETFFKSGVCGALAWGINAFVFEAFDEPWKPDSIGDNGKAADERHWGVFDENRKPKFTVRC